MKCINCKNRGNIRIQTGIGMYRSCFLKIAEKRVRKEVRTKKIFRKNDSIIVLDNKSCKAKVTASILKSILKDLPVRIKIVSTLAEADEKAGNKIVVPWSLDDENRELIERIFFDKKPSEKNNTIKLLKDLSDEEIRMIAEIKKLKCEEKFEEKAENDLIKNKLEEFHQKYPATRFALAKTGKALKEYMD